MLYLKTKIVCLILVLLVMIFSCEKDPSPLFTNCVLKGYALTSDYETDYAGTNITAYGPYGSKTTTTDESGQFTFTGLGNGTYRLEYSRKGYGTIVRYNIRLFGSDTVEIGGISVFRRFDNFIMPAFLNVSTGTESYNANTVYIETTMSTYTSPLPVVVFTDTLNTLNYKTSQNFRSVYSQFSSTHPEHLSFTFETYGLPFRKGATVYLIAYVCNSDEITYNYLDQYLGIPQFSTLIPDKHSVVMSFIMP
jgi:hypothetical protein